MLYLATASGPKVVEAMKAGELGQMITPLAGNAPIPRVVKAYDNGCFSNRWTEKRWLDKLHSLDPSEYLFAVVPDVVCDAKETDRLWKQWSGVVESAGFRPAYVTQNGCRGIPDNAQCVFTGGDNPWKLGGRARRLMREGWRGGLWTHMGRVNSLKRLRIAANDGYDSVDGTLLAFGPDVNLPKLLRWMETITSENRVDLYMVGKGTW